MLVDTLISVESLWFRPDRGVVVAAYLGNGRVGWVTGGRRRWRLLLDDREGSTLVVVSVSHVFVKQFKEVFIQGGAGEMGEVGLTGLCCLDGAHGL